MKPVLIGIATGATMAAIITFFARRAEARVRIDLPRREPAPGPAPAPTPTPSAPELDRYVPGSPEQYALFEAAAIAAGLPQQWAREEGLVNILTRESQGWVGRPNYTYGERSRDHSRWSEVWAELRAGKKTARSSATGLGQLILANVDTYYPGATVAERRAGIGTALNEAVGMLRYIEARYGTPAHAWAQYGKAHEGY